MTITEKILLNHCDKNSVSPGEIVEVSVDLAFGNDITVPPAIKEFERADINKVFAPEKIVIVNDHFVPNKDIASAEQAKLTRNFAKKYNIINHYDVGRCGIGHALLPEQGFIAPGDLVIGADSHTCTYGALGAFSTGVGSTDLAAVFATGKIWLKVPETILLRYNGKLQKWVSGKDLILYTIGLLGVDGANYKTLEFVGSVISELSIFDRFTMANMVIEAGAKNGIFNVDEKTLNFLKGRTHRLPKILESDESTYYHKVVDIDVSPITPQVACPSSPENVKAVDDLKNVKIDQSFIGSCTNGWLSDLKIAADILKGKKVHSSVRLIVIPATPAIYLEALREGLIEIFIEAGGAVSTPTCGPCLGGHMGILAADEVAVSTTNRNFVGRMGHVKSQVYLSNPAVAAASAVSGYIISPEKL